MSLMVPFLTGFAGAIVANLIGYNITDYQWWLICLPWWLLGAVINMN